MFHHVKDLQFNARVSKPDARFAGLLLEQFGGPNGELKAAMTYFIQAFGCKKAFPDKYDLLMDIATEEFSHLEIVGATIQMLLTGVNGDLKNAAEESELMQVMGGNKKSAMENLVHGALSTPQFFTVSGGGPILTNSASVPFSGSYIDANGDLSVDLRSDIAAESRAKIVYEYLLQFTDDPYVKESLHFLMAREVAHFQMFQAALDTIQPNFPPGVLQSDPKYTNTYFNMSDGNNAKGPWNEGKSTHLGETWQVVEDPIKYVKETKGQTDVKIKGTTRTEASTENHDKNQSTLMSEKIKKAAPKDEIAQWSDFKKA
jgi:Mn-containing catalase